MPVLAVAGLPGSAIAGIPGGASFALLAVALVLLYRMAGVVSFAQGSVGVFGAVLFQQLDRPGTPMIVAVLAGLALSAAMWMAFGWVMAKWFSTASLLVRSAVTIGMSVSLGAVALVVYGGNARLFPLFFPNVEVTIGSVVIPGSTILAVCLAVCVAAVVTGVIRFTRLGIWLRATSERASTAALLAVPVGRLTVGVWAFTGMIAALAIMLLAPTQVTDVTDLGQTSIEALAAALVAQFRSVWVALVAALAIGIFESVASATSLTNYSSTIPLLVVLVVLLWSKRGEAWNEAR